MIKINIHTYGSVNTEVGWDTREINLDQRLITIEDVLKLVKSEDGRVLFDLVCEEGRIKESHMMMLNGRPLRNPDALTMAIKDKDTVTVLDSVRLAAGG